VLATKKAARTARFTFSQVTSSTNQFLASTQTGSGVVSFSSDAGEVTIVQHNVSPSQTGSGPRTATPMTVVERELLRGRTAYVDLSNAGLPDVGSRWIVTRHLPQSFTGVFVLSGLADVPGVLSPGPSFSVVVTAVGSQVVEGALATEYSVAASSTCPAPVSLPDQARLTIGPTRVWVDGAGRLVRLRTTLHAVDPFGGVAHGSNAFSGTATTVDTLQLRDFGAPVALEVPPTRQLLQGVGSSFIVDEARSCA